MPVPNVSKQLEIILDEYAEQLGDEVADICKDIADDAVSELKSSSPRSDRVGKHYADGWDQKKEGEYGRIVYNKTKPELTYLLNNGHQIANQHGTHGRAEGDGHIDRVEEKMNARMIEEVKKRI